MESKQDESTRLRSAMRELRTEPVDVDAKARLLTGLTKPAGRLRIRPTYVALAFGVSSLALLLVPRQPALAWSQVVDSTLASIRFHEAYFSPNAKTGAWEVTMESWQDGKKHAFTVKPPPQSKGHYSRVVGFDGRRSFVATYDTVKVVATFPRENQFGDFSDRVKFQKLLTSKWITVDPVPEKAELNGVALLRYSARHVIPAPEKHASTSKLAIFVDPEKQLIMRTEELSETGKLLSYSTVEYPDQIDPAHFEPPHDDRPLYDLDKDAVALRESMKHGVALGRGDVLRAAIGMGSSVFVAWTGTPPPGDGSIHPLVPGFKVKQVYGPTEFTASRVRSKPMKIFSVQFQGQPICGQTLELDHKVGDRITLRMPILVEDHSRPIVGQDGKLAGYESKKIGERVVKDFPVLHMLWYDTITHMRFDGK